MQSALLIFICCLFPFLMTVLGAAAVFLCPWGVRSAARRVFLGFSAGVMLAASIWSLLDPAIEAARARGGSGWITASVGTAAGVLFLLVTDFAVCGMRSRGVCSDRAACGSFLLQLAMTVHNIPEGMAVGLSAALAADALQSSAAGIPLSELFGAGVGIGAELSAALVLSLGIGIQNLPEGAAVSLPLRQDGMSVQRSFLRGCASGAVEPVFGIAAALFLREADLVMPWLLSFAAGAMLYAVICELIPAAVGGEDTVWAAYLGTLSTVVGFLLMMSLDVALG